MSTVATAAIQSISLPVEIKSFDAHTVVCVSNGHTLKLKRSNFAEKSLRAGRLVIVSLQDPDELKNFFETK